jgi:hypothetical protein
MFFRFPPDARWNAERAAVEFSIGIGEYEGPLVWAGAYSKACSTNHRRLSGVLKPTIFTEPGSNSSPNGRCAAGNSPRTRM